MVSDAAGTRSALEPTERIAEVLFGLIMVLTFTGSLSVAEADRAEVRTMLVGALGCNLAWGIIDAVFYLMGIMLAKGGGLLTFRAVRQATDHEVPTAFARMAFSVGIEAWLRAVFACNAYVDTQAPWALRKTDPERMAAVLGTLVAAVRELARAIAPIIPASAEKLLALIAGGEGGAPIAQPTPLFPRLELEEAPEAVQ